MMYLVAIIFLTIISLYIVKKIKFIDVPEIRFVIVGVLNTEIYYISFLFLNNILLYIWAHIISFLISALISFFLTTMYTFNAKPTLINLIKFPLTFLPNLLLSTIGTTIIVNMGLIEEKYASLIVMILIIPITYLVGKLLYKKEKNG